MINRVSTICCVCLLAPAESGWASQRIAGTELTDCGLQRILGQDDRQIRCRAGFHHTQADTRATVNKVHPHLNLGMPSIRRTSKNVNCPVNEGERKKNSTTKKCSRDINFRISWSLPADCPTNIFYFFISISEQGWYATMPLVFAIIVGCSRLTDNGCKDARFTSILTLTYFSWQ